MSTEPQPIVGRWTAKPIPTTTPAPDPMPEQGTPRPSPQVTAEAAALTRALSVETTSWGASFARVLSRLDPYDRALLARVVQEARAGRQETDPDERDHRR